MGGVSISTLDFIKKKRQKCIIVPQATTKYWPFFLIAKHILFVGKNIGNQKQFPCDIKPQVSNINEETDVNSCLSEKGQDKSPFFPSPHQVCKPSPALFFFLPFLCITFFAMPAISDGFGSTVD